MSASIGLIQLLVGDRNSGPPWAAPLRTNTLIAPVEKKKRHEQQRHGHRVPQHHQALRQRQTRPAVKGISFEVPRGTLTTIPAPRLMARRPPLRMIAGLESPTSGEIFIGGKDVTTLGPRAAQREHDVPELRAVPAHECGGERDVRPAHVGPAKSRRAKAVEGAARRWAWGYDDRLPSELSGGQQQRAWPLARALVLEPRCCCSTSPLSNLDARLRREMREEIRALQQRLSLTVAYVTYDQAEAMAVSDQIIVMNQGLIAQKGSPRAVRNPAQRVCRGFSWARPCCSRPWPTLTARWRSARWCCARMAVKSGPVKVAGAPEAWRAFTARGMSLLPARLDKRPTWARCTNTPSRPRWATSSWCRPIWTMCWLWATRCS